MGSSISSIASCSPSSLEETMNSKIFYPPQRNYNIEQLNSQTCTMFKTYAKLGETLHFARVTPKNTPNAKKYIILSHGNGGDVYGMISYGQYLADSLQTVVILYDYPGYGHSSGNSSEINCYDSIDAIVHYVQNSLHVNQKDITLMGQSLGTGIVVDYVSKNEWTSPVILVSPYKSIVTVIYDSSIVAPIDKFKSLSKLGNVSCPVKIFHGDADQLINISHGKTLYENLNDKTFKPSWLPGIGHNDILSVLDLKELQQVINHNK